MRFLVGRTTTTLLAAAVLALAAGCGGDDESDGSSGSSSTAGTSAPAQNTPPDEAALTEALLTEADLPGYTASTDDGSDDTGDDGSGIRDGDAGCKKVDELDTSLDEGTDKDMVGDVDRDFEKSGSETGPFLTAGLISFRNGGAERVFGEYTAAYGDCHSFTLALDESTSMQVTGGRVDGFPKLGDASDAFRYTGTLQGVPVQVDFALVRVGDVLSGTSAISLATPAPDLSSQAATKAAERLQSALGG